MSSIYSFYRYITYHDKYPNFTSLPPTPLLMNANHKKLTDQEVSIDLDMGRIGEVVAELNDRKYGVALCGNAQKGPVGQWIAFSPTITPSRPCNTDKPAITGGTARRRNNNSRCHRLHQRRRIDDPLLSNLKDNLCDNR